MTMYTIIIYIYIYVYINIECKCFIYFQLPEMRMRIPLCKMLLVTVIPLQFPQTSLGFLISDCKSDCKISKNMFHHFYIFIYFRFWPVLFMGNGVISISRWHSTAEIHPHDPKQSHTPQKDLTKQKTHHSSLKKKKTLASVSCHDSQKCDLVGPKTLSWSIDPRYDFHLWTPATSGDPFQAGLTRRFKGCVSLPLEKNGRFLEDPHIKVSQLPI